MIYTTLALFGIAALGGILLVYLKKSGKGIPISVAICHGIFAASGLVLLIIYIFTAKYSIYYGISAAIFIVAALGGFYLFTNHIKKKPLPENVISIHAFTAIIAFCTLLAGVFIK